MLSVQGGAISWKTRRKPTVALSSTEVEYMSLSAATQEALLLILLVIVLLSMKIIRVLWH